MIKRVENKLLRVGLFILFTCLGALLTAQTNGLKIAEPYGDNDNWRYFQDVSCEVGLYTATTTVGDLSDGLVTSISSGYFFNQWFGARSGVSMITYLDDYDPYIKVPCMIAFRTPTVRLTISEPETFKEILANLFLLFLPTRFEFNIGPSLGYAWNNQRHFASSIDANLRMGFQFWRIGINGNMGINYLWTKNFVERDVFRNKRVRPAWYANLSIGVSFRF